MLRRIFYVSTISAGTTPTDVQAIVASSMVWNRRHDITGLLVASQRNFAQVIEGRDEHMTTVMDRIRRDTHHRAIEVQTDGGINQRIFGRWSMSYVQRDDLSDDLRRLHSSHDPALMETILKGLARASGDVAADL